MCISICMGWIMALRTTISYIVDRKKLAIRQPINKKKWNGAISKRTAGQKPHMFHANKFCTLDFFYFKGWSQLELFFIERRKLTIYVYKFLSPPGGIVGENWSTRSKTTVSSKRVGPLGSNGAPLLGSTVLSFN